MRGPDDDIPPGHVVVRRCLDLSIDSPFPVSGRQFKQGISTDGFGISEGKRIFLDKANQCWIYREAREIFVVPVICRNIFSKADVSPAFILPSSILNMFEAQLSPDKKLLAVQTSSNQVVSYFST